MRRMNLFAGGMVVAMGLAMASPAAAAVANTNVNVRATPGGTVVDVLQRGEQANIVGRSGGWCQVTKSGPDGWVACQYLSNGGYDDDVRPGRPNVDVSVSFSIPGFSFSIGEGGFDRPGRPGRPGRDSVCFYEDVNFGGSSFCMRPGERMRSLGGWNDRISSIRVRGDGEALVCEHDRFRGRCVTIDRNVRNLGPRGNDIISSIRVR
jgi:uncharacterized protein YraI